MPGSFAFLIELQRPVQIAVVGERQGVHAQLFGPFDQLVDRAGPVQQAVMAVAMQMNKRRRAHVSSGEPVERSIQKKVRHQSADSILPAADFAGKQPNAGQKTGSTDVNRRNSDLQILFFSRFADFAQIIGQLRL